MESKALVKSTNSNVASRFFARTPSRILRMVNICEVVDLFSSENPPKVTHEPITRIINKQLDIKRGTVPLKKNSTLFLEKLKNRKAAGLDEIHPEVWKTRQFDDILLRHCNAVYNQKPIDRWIEGCILPFPKKGDLGLAKNYRFITLTSIAAKIYNALLRNRIEPKIDNIWGTSKVIFPQQLHFIYHNSIISSSNKN